MDVIDLDLLRALDKLSSSYNDLVNKYRELNARYFDIQMNIAFIRSNVLDLDMYNDRIERILQLINNCVDTRYIKGSDTNENS